MPKLTSIFLFCVPLVVLSSADLGFTKLVRPRSAREGILDAQLVAIVRQKAPDLYEIEEVYWGNAEAGDSISLQGFQLSTRQEYGADLIDPISSETRILLFLRHKTDDPSGWEPTDYGYCFFWVQETERIFQLRNTAQAAVALRRRWEEAASIPDPQRRVEGLWPYIHLQEYGVSFLEHTKAELRKTGQVAGDYFAQQFDGMSPDDRSPLYYEAGSYGSEKLHQTMIRQLRREQQDFQGFLATRGLSGRAFLENWNSVPQDIKDAYGDISGILYGLRSIEDRADLPLFRDVAIWGVKFGAEQACEMALGAFREMPDKDNLPAIYAIWEGFADSSMEYREPIFHDVVAALCAYRFPETVPLLAPLVTHPYAGSEVEDALSQIVGKDLGRTPQPWLDWYAMRKGKGPGR